MENIYKKYNNIIGWMVWLTATIVYVMTLEPTASFWDCGEFIATAHKLEVGHPPGAPLWLMISRVFGLLAGGDVSMVAYYINLFSGLCSSFSILFLFWSITHLAKKMITKNGKSELVQGDIWAILFSGAIGALAYTFSDSFWYSAVEGEVYAASSLFTALVFWLILKWERVADEVSGDRYLILIAYMMGLSIGVHLLNLLVIPAIALIYYFRKFETTLKGSIIAFIVGFIVLIFVQYGIIPQSVYLASIFELFTVNGIGLPQHSGVFLFLIAVFGGLVWGMKKAHESDKVNLFKVFMGIAVILIGYSSYAMIVIRSSANTPMDENNPDNIFSLLPYLNREQYGDRPLVYGQAFTSPMNPREGYTASGGIADLWKDGSSVRYWDEEKGEYYIADKRELSVPTYVDEFNSIFPRMYSTDKKHKERYIHWSDFEGETVEYMDPRDRKTKTGIKPTLAENVSFFINYQIKFMYWRYFMWNFSGKQNDLQSHGSPLKGNWISGVEMIDQQMVGSSINLPEEFMKNPGRNTFFMLPLILGLIGGLFQLKYRQTDFVITAVLFFMTGIAIILYLNQYPLQPRERDYAFSGSFYAFAIWIGLGVLGLYQAMKDQTIAWNEILTFGGAFIGLGVVGFSFESLAANDHGFSYSLMYIGVVGIGLVGLSKILGAAVKEQKTQAVIALGLTAFIPYNMGAQGWDDHDRSNRFTSRDFAVNYLQSCAPNAIIFTNGDNDTFPLWYVQEVEGIRTDVRVVNLSLLNTDWYITQMKRKAYDSEPVPFSMTEPQYRQGGSRDIIFLEPNTEYFKTVRSTKSFLELKDVMNFVKNDKKVIDTDEYPYNYSPTKNFKMTIDPKQIIATKTVGAEFVDKIVNEMRWSMSQSQLQKNKLMILDLISTNNWERPVYFAITVGDDNFINLQPYFQLEGLAYRLVPIYTKPDPENRAQRGTINTDIMFDNFMNKFEWGNVKMNGVYMDENNRRMCTNLRSNFASLAEALIKEGKNDSAKLVLDKCLEEIPHAQVPYDYFSSQAAKLYIEIGEKETAISIAKAMKVNCLGKLDYYFSLSPDFANKADVKKEVSREIQLTLRSLLYLFGDLNLMKEVEELENKFGYYTDLGGFLQQYGQGKISEEDYYLKVSNLEVDFFDTNEDNIDLEESTNDEDSI